MFIGFSGTPLLKADKKRSIEVFGRYIHTYRFDEAVKDKVVLDLRYEARDIDQRITSQAKIDQWFEAKTKGFTDIAKAQLKQRWGTMRNVLPSQSRLNQIVADIQMDMATRDRLSSGYGNAILVAGSIYEACKLYDLFDNTDLKGREALRFVGFELLDVAVVFRGEVSELCLLILGPFDWFAQRSHYLQRVLQPLPRLPRRSSSSPATSSLS